MLETKHKCWKDAVSVCTSRTWSGEADRIVEPNYNSVNRGRVDEGKGEAGEQGGP